MLDVTEPTSLQPEELLAIAIIDQAAEDYRMTRRKLRTNPKHKESLWLKQDCEKFFRSAWYRMLTTVDGAWLLRRLEEEPDEEEEEDEDEEEEEDEENEEEEDCEDCAEEEEE